MVFEELYNEMKQMQKELEFLRNVARQSQKILGYVRDARDSLMSHDYKGAMHDLTKAVTVHIDCHCQERDSSHTCHRCAMHKKANDWCEELLTE